MGQRSLQERNWRTLENDRRHMDSAQTRHSSGPDPNPAIAMLKEHETRWKESPSMTSTNSNAQVATPSRHAHSDRCRVRIEECLRITPEVAETLDRRSEVINEALAEEIQ